MNASDLFRFGVRLAEGVDRDFFHSLLLERAVHAVALCADNAAVSYTHLDVYKRQGSGKVEYGSMGAIFAGIFGVIVACVMIGMQFSQGFGFAVKMGVSRRRYLAGAFAAAFALMIFALRCV